MKLNRKFKNLEKKKNISKRNDDDNNSWKIHQRHD